MVNLECLFCISILRFFQSIVLSAQHKHCILYFRSPTFVRQLLYFPNHKLPVLRPSTREFDDFAKGRKRHMYHSSHPYSMIIWTHCQGNADSVWTLMRYKRAWTDVAKWNRVEEPPLRADRKATRQHELFLLIKIHEHVSVFVCLLTPCGSKWRRFQHCEC